MILVSLPWRAEVVISCFMKTGSVEYPKNLSGMEYIAEVPMVLKWRIVYVSMKLFFWGVYKFISLDLGINQLCLICIVKPTTQEITLPKKDVRKIFSKWIESLVFALCYLQKVIPSFIPLMYHKKFYRGWEVVATFYWALSFPNSKILIK